MRRLVYVSDAYPALSQTFTVREVRELQAAGLPMLLVSLRPPGPGAPPLEPARDPELWQAPWPLAPGPLLDLLRVLPRQPRAAGAPLLRSFLPHTRPFWPRMQARAPLHVAWGAWLARRLAGKGPLHFHAQFAWGASTTAWVAARLTGGTFSFTSHSDFGLPLVAPKLRDVSLVLAISEFEKRRLLALAPELPPSRVRVHRLGVDLPALPDPGRRRAPGPVRLLAVGGLGATKGHEVLLRACALLQERRVDLELDLVGEGPLGPELSRLHRELGLSASFRLLGARPHAEVLRLTAAADIVVLACRVTPRGDQDGIPVSLMEGMACGKPAVSTRVSGIPELIEDGREGRLVAPEDPGALAAALAELAGDEDLRGRLGAAARAKVELLHDARESRARVVGIFRELLEA